MMSSEKFKRFLEIESRRKPLSVSEERVSWEEKGERTLSSQPSDFLESVYLGKELQNTVVMERSVAAMLQHRLTELEKENGHLRSSVRILKFVLGGFVVVTLLVWVVLNVY